MKNKGYKNEFEKVSREFYSAVHHWLKVKYGVAVRCENKKCLGKSKNFNWAKKKGAKYGFKRKDFIQLCRSCHAKMDTTDRMKERMRLLNTNTDKTHCKNGHEFTPENTYLYKTKTRENPERRCFTCAKRLRKEYNIRQRLKRKLIKSNSPSIGK